MLMMMTVINGDMECWQVREKRHARHMTRQGGLHLEICKAVIRKVLLWNLSPSLKVYLTAPGRLGSNSLFMTHFIR